MAVPLVIDNVALANLKVSAEANPIFMSELIEISEGRASAPGNRDEYSLNMPINFRVVFTIEEHPQGEGQGNKWFKHMSMSLAVPGRMPNVPAIALVCEALGFLPLEDCHINFEKNYEFPYIEVLCPHEPI